MHKTLTENYNFDFSYIYPKCRRNFKWLRYSYYDNVANKLTTLCSNFNKDNIDGSSEPYFIQDCQLVTYYLKHINDEKSNVNACCKYFFYKLKDLLINRKWKCETLTRCYEEMQKLSKIGDNANILGFMSLCKNSYPNEFDDNIFQIFRNLDVIYDKFKKLESDIDPSYWAFYEFGERMKFLEANQNKYDNSLRLLLKEFNDNIIEFVDKLEKKNNSSGIKSFLRGIKYWGYTKGVLTMVEKNIDINSSIEIERTTDISTNVEIYENISAHTDTQISTGVIFSFFAIFMIIFILYKYTPFGSSLQPKARALRKLMKKKNKKHIKLIGSYENMYNALNDKQYEIAYRSI